MLLSSLLSRHFSGINKPNKAAYVKGSDKCSYPFDIVPEDDVLEIRRSSNPLDVELCLQNKKGPSDRKITMRRGVLEPTPGQERLRRSGRAAIQDIFRQSGWADSERRMHSRGTRRESDLSKKPQS